MFTQSRRSFLVACLLVSCTLSFEICAQVAPSDAALLESPIRTERDRQADARRKPLELLKLAQIAPGMTVLDVASGGGYTAQLLALAVGANGKVWAQIARPSAALEARLAAHPQVNLQVLTRPLEDLFSAELPRVDRVTLILSYHDIVNTPTERSKMNQAIFNALKPGGFLIVMDHSAKPGSGVSDTSTLHRIDQQAIVAELTAVGFKLDGKSEAWANPADTYEQHSSKMDVPSDRFALRFVRPN
jgi:predicted methyltransferase